MPLRYQIYAWIALLAALLILLYVFRGILLPFVAGLALAYLLDPVADWLERRGLGRGVATSLVMLLFVLLIVSAFVLVVPLILQQGFGLIRNLPGYFEQLQGLVQTAIPRLEDWLGPDRLRELETGVEQMAADATGWIAAFTAQIAQSSMGIINTLGLLVVTPVVAFYMLLDWDRMVESVDSLFPPKHKGEIRAIFKEMDVALAGFVRGQGAVVGILALYYGISLSLAGLSFGLAIGIIAGLFSFVPYVGFLVGFVLSIGVALVQFWPDWVMISVIVFIYLFGQFLEGNVLYPKLVGSSIGVHPVWLMFALFAFAVIFGPVGVLLAVPLAAISGVLVRWAVRTYKQSPLYDPDHPVILTADANPVPRKEEQ